MFNCVRARVHIRLVRGGDSGGRELASEVTGLVARLPHRAARAWVITQIGSKRLKPR